MKTNRTIRIALVLMLSGLIAILATNIAFASNGVHAGPNMPQETDACAGCHRAHTGVQSGLLASGTDKYSFCTSCHDGTGANTNVNGGMFEGVEGILPDGTDWNTGDDGEDLKGLNGGGFVQAAAYTGIVSRDGFVGKTSRHKIVGLDAGASFPAYGGGPAGSGPGPNIALTCTTCHDAHGVDNADGSDRYRMLLKNVDGTDLSLLNVSSWEDDEAEDYTKIQYKSGTAAFCVACHDNYMADGQYDAGDTQGVAERYRHKVNGAISLGSGAPKTGNNELMSENINNKDSVTGLAVHAAPTTVLPLEQSGSQSDDARETDKMVCLTCHQAHGSSANMSVNSSVAPASSSALLRMNDRGVCQDCHQK